ncbi:hypothetical protein ACHAWF_016948 [Thalassiosira exigua]
MAARGRRRPLAVLLLSSLRLAAASSSASAAAGASSRAFAPSGSSVRSSSFSSLGPRPTSRLRLLQVLVIHRHGDRTPITPLRDEDRWAAALPSPEVLAGVARGTTLIGGGEEAHPAAGRGSFGQLTMRGLLQMVGLGERLREELGHVEEHTEDADRGGGDGHAFENRGRLFTPERPLCPSRVRVMSTDFPRTIQSVQGVLAGLFPDMSPETDGGDRGSSAGEGEGGGGTTERPMIEIDLRGTNAYFIPDPSPRQSSEQSSLESHLSQRPHLLEREDELRGLARRVTHALRDHLGEKARGVSFGIGEDVGTEEVEKPLPWIQLSEVLTCLHARDMLPESLTEGDLEAVSDHAAWRWFENLRHPVLAKSSMWRFADGLVEAMQRKATAGRGGEAGDDDEEPWLCLYSAHDSTLIGLLCVLQLEQPARWPEYGSALRAELIQEESDGNEGSPRHWVQFSLNGELLRSTWRRDARGEPSAMVPLEELTDMIHAEHELFEDEEAGSRLKYRWKDGLLTEH